MLAFGARSPAQAAHLGQEQPLPSDADLSDSWAQLVGTRVARTLVLMADPCACSSLSALSLTLGPLQMVTAWQLETQSARAAALKNGTCRVAPMLNLTWPATSPVHLAIQHYGWLLSQTPDQSSVWLCLRGPEFDRSLASQAVVLDQLHHMLLTAAAGLWIRTTHILHSWPWRMLLLADQRRSDLQEIARSFFQLQHAACLVHPAALFGA